jgi:(R,R)-butanediol dehydrogenase / meso-butanediol dehydrogenase / diacetyl reductase
VRAVTVTESFRLAPADVPDPQIDDEGVLVRVAACGVCGSDLHLLETRLLRVGAILGHEASGVVERVGSSVRDVAVGDHVAVQPFDPCHTCPACVSGDSQRCASNVMTTLGLGFRAGAYAELVAVSRQMVVKVPEALPLDVAAVSEPLAVAFHGYRRSDFRAGMTVGVIGCGPIGLSAVALGRSLGAGHVWASDPNAFRQELAASLGADDVGAKPLDADIVFECAGAKGTIDLAVSSVRGGGQVVLLAVNALGDEVWPLVWITKEAVIVPCLGYTVDEYAACAQMIAEGRIDVTPMITRRASFDEADEAIHALMSGAPEGKVLIVP